MQPELQVAVLEADGYAICPDCGTRVKCGSVGLNNLEKCHRGSDKATKMALCGLRGNWGSERREALASMMSYFHI
jgi:hypothetical protein